MRTFLDRQDWTHREFVLRLVSNVLGSFLLATSVHAADPAADWPCYGRDPGGARQSPLTQINRENVKRLAVAWTYRTGELERVTSKSLMNKVTFEATPLAIDGALYFSTPSSRIIALEAHSGRELWTFDPKLNMRLVFSEGASRGVSYWKASDGSGDCRLFAGTLDARLIAVDATTGKACADFGQGGEIDLAAELRNSPRGLYSVTSPPAIIDDTVVIGSAIGDNGRFDASPGVVRGFDARSGKLRWSFDPVPRSADQAGAETWKGDQALKTGAANVWSIMSVDPQRHLVFLPTSCPSPDFYGGLRLGDNLFANSVVAVDARAGKVVWHFQVVHHDIWDYDIAAQPILFDLMRNGATRPAVAVGTKTGQVFVLDRDTGKPLFDVEERPVPQTDVDGEATSRTQPFSSLPALGLQKAEPWGRNEQESAASKNEFESLRYEGIFTPPSLRGTIIAPANVGGINWSGMTIDRERQLLVTNVNRLASVVRLIPRSEFGSPGGARLGEERAPQSGTPFGMARRVLRIPDARLPATAPPWGTLAAIDLQSGKLRWEVPLGWMIDPAQAPEAANWGSVNLGGAITTAAGLVFVAASIDGHLRAFDVETGNELWKAELPAGGQATPMTCQAGPDGKQYVIIAAGGHARLGTKLGDYIVAFALP